MKALNHFRFIAIREDPRNQRDAFIQAERTTDQAFPRWNAAAVWRRIRIYMRGTRIKTYKPHGIRGASGRRRGS